MGSIQPIQLGDYGESPIAFDEVEGGGGLASSERVPANVDCIDI